MTKPARHTPHLQPSTEKQVVAAVRGRFLLAGWYPVATEANNVGRGKLKSGKPRPGALPKGFPDHLFTRGLGNGFGLVVFVEFKNSKGGRLSADQKLMHRNLDQNFQQAVHVVTSLEEAEAIIQQARKLEALLKGGQS